MAVFNKKGQSALEAAILFVMAIAALIALQQYFKRSYEGRLKSSSEQIGSPFDSETSGGNVVTTITGDETSGTTQTTTYGETLGSTFH